MIGIQNETNKYCIYFYSFIIINKFINLFILLNLYKIRIFFKELIYNLEYYLLLFQVIHIYYLF